MRWFKHLSSARNDEMLAELKEEFGAEGYGVFWIILEIIASTMDETDKCFARFPLKFWSNSAGISVKKFQNIVKFLANFEQNTKEKFSFSEKKDGKYLTIECRNLLKYRDEYTQSKSKKSGVYREKLRKKSGVTPEQKQKQKQNTETDKEIYKEKSSFSDSEFVNAPKIPVKKILDYLNQKTGSNFSFMNPTYERVITEQWLTGLYTVDDFQMVTDLKIEQWFENPEMSGNLRPQTLYGQHFDSYLQQARRTYGNKPEQNFKEAKFVLSVDGEDQFKAFLSEKNLDEIQVRQWITEHSENQLTT